MKKTEGDQLTTKNRTSPTYQTYQKIQTEARGLDPDFPQQNTAQDPQTGKIYMLRFPIDGPVPQEMNKKKLLNDYSKP